VQGRGLIAWVTGAGLLLGAAVAVGQTPPDAPGAAPPGGAPLGTPQPGPDNLVQLDFNDVELSVVIDTIARLTS
jgi:hypothetical protein